MANENNYEKIFNDVAFKNISQRKLQLLKEMFVLMQNKTNEQKLQILFGYGMKMKQMGLQLTPNESKAIMNALKKNLPKKDQDKFDMMIKMMEMMKK